MKYQTIPVGQRNQDQDQDLNHHRNQRRLQKEKLVQERYVVQLVKRKALDEKRHREYHNNPLFYSQPIIGLIAPSSTHLRLLIVLLY
jgi:hypothetical protein